MTKIGGQNHAAQTGATRWFISTEKQRCSWEDTHNRGLPSNNGQWSNSPESVLLQLPGKHAPLCPKMLTARSGMHLLQRLACAWFMACLARPCVYGAEGLSMTKCNCEGKISHLVALAGHRLLAPLAVLSSLPQVLGESLPRSTQPSSRRKTYSKTATKREGEAMCLRGCLCSTTCANGDHSASTARNKRAALATSRRRAPPRHVAASTTRAPRRLRACEQRSATPGAPFAQVCRHVHRTGTKPNRVCKEPAEAAA